MEQMKTKQKIRKIINTVFFSILLLSTLVVAIFMIYDSCTSHNEDDIFGSSTALEYIVMYILIITPIVVAECDIYFNIKYFFLIPVNHKIHATVNGVLLISSIIILLLQPLFIKLLIFEIEFIWLICYLILRLIQYTIFKFKHKSYTK